MLLSVMKALMSGGNPLLGSECQVSSLLTALGTGVSSEAS